MDEVIIEHSDLKVGEVYRYRRFKHSYFIVLAPGRIIPTLTKTKDKIVVQELKPPSKVVASDRTVAEVLAGWGISAQNVQEAIYENTLLEAGLAQEGQVYHQHKLFAKTSRLIYLIENRGKLEPKALSWSATSGLRLTKLRNNTKLYPRPQVSLQNLCDQWGVTLQAAMGIVNTCEQDKIFRRHLVPETIYLTPRKLPVIFLRHEPTKLVILTACKGKCVEVRRLESAYLLRSELTLQDLSQRWKAPITTIEHITEKNLGINEKLTEAKIGQVYRYRAQKKSKLIIPLNKTQALVCSTPGELRVVRARNATLSPTQLTLSNLPELWGVSKEQIRFICGLFLHHAPQKNNELVVGTVYRFGNGNNGRYKLALVVKNAKDHHPLVLTNSQGKLHIAPLRADTTLYKIYQPSMKLLAQYWQTTVAAIDQMVAPYFQPDPTKRVKGKSAPAKNGKLNNLLKIIETITRKN